jgi:hypothetical protein
MDKIVEQYEAMRVDVPASALPKFVFALLSEKYSGRNGAVDEFRLL